jgi:hypothetical protein
VKRFYARAHKGQHVRSISKLQRRERILFQMGRMHQKKETSGKRRRYKRTALPSIANRTVSFNESDPLPPSIPDVHHHMSSGVRHKINLSEWLGEHEDDCFASRYTISSQLHDCTSHIFLPRNSCLG